MIRLRQLTVPAIALFLGMYLNWVGSAAPAPKPESTARKKLENLKKTVLPLVARFLKKDPDDFMEPEVKLARLIAPAKAKITFRFKEIMHGKRDPVSDVLLSVYLSYYDGRWTTTSHSDLNGLQLDINKLMLLIDEAGEE